ncbi:MAG: cytosolic protein [Candidatus Shapirobacteria bacterium]
MECKKKINAKNCPCTYDCETKGCCCECLQYHLKRKELPACCFSPEAEKTYDRSFKKFIEENSL